MRNVFTLVLAAFLLAFLTPFASAEEGGGVRPEDFSYKGVALGDTEEALLSRYGAPLFDTDRIANGVPVKVYTFRGHIDVAVAKKTGRVVDFAIEDEDFSIRGVRRGATVYWIQKTFGKAKAERLDGRTAYVYRRAMPSAAGEAEGAGARSGAEEAEKACLVLYIDPESRILTGLRLTALPLTAEEAAHAAENLGTDEGVGEIDLSALSKEDVPRLGGMY